ncbi:MAG: DUF3363 domain-containing protein [Alphaproteobacteria bacterium]|nr:DUF3363 domain-containing protein [Alphaproteobacteria bacterium]
MMDADEFLPRLGERRSLFASSRPRYLNLVLQQVQRMGGFARPRRSYAGRGRGAGVARVLALSDPHPGLRLVRVAPRIARVQGKLSAVRQHLRYITREGVGRATVHGRLYDAITDQADKHGFVSRTRADQYQFRIVVAVEDGWEYASLHSFTRCLLKDMERDLGTRLEWVAADHYNTGLPHTHIVVRGIDEMGKELRIAREYLREGMSTRAGAIATLDLGALDPAGPRHRAFANTFRSEPSALDARLQSEANAHGELVLAGKGYDSFQHSLLAARLQTLRALGLAEERRGGRWQLQPCLHPTLEALATRSWRLGRLDREISRHGLLRTARERAIFDPLPDARRPLLGRLLGQDKARDGRGFLILDGVDGRSYFVDLGYATRPPVADGAIVAVRPCARDADAHDRAIAEIARSHDGRYSAALHRAVDPDLDMHMIEHLLQRLRVLAPPLDLREVEPGAWQVGTDFLARVRGLKAAQARLYPVEIEVLSKAPLERAITMEGPCWLDRGPIIARERALSARGFGRELQEALASRRLRAAQLPDARHLGQQMVSDEGSLHGSVRAADRAGAMLGVSMQDRGDPGRSAGDIILCFSDTKRRAPSISR